MLHQKYKFGNNPGNVHVILRTTWNILLFLLCLGGWIWSIEAIKGLKKFYKKPNQDKKIVQQVIPKKIVQEVIPIPLSPSSSSMESKMIRNNNTNDNVILTISNNLHLPFIVINKFINRKTSIII